MASAKTAVDEELAKFKVLQSDIQTLYSTKQQTLSQYNENTMVKEELDILPKDAVVYKLVGPALLKVDFEDAKENVNKRLEFIGGEMTKIDNQIAAKQSEQTEIGEKVSKIQQKMQEEAALAARQIMSDQNK